MRSLILEFIGVTARWIALSLYAIFTKKKAPTFKEIWNGDTSAPPADQLSYGCMHIIIGFFLLGLALHLIYYFSHNG